MDTQNNEFPTDDSDDLTDEEIASAIQAASPQDIASELRRRILHLSCEKCGGKVDVFRHEIRRRKPSVFWRTTMSCFASGCFTRTSVMFQANFLPPE